MRIWAFFIRVYDDLSLTTDNIVPSENNTWFSGQHCLWMQYINHPRYPQITPCVMVADALVPDKHQTVRNNDVVLTRFGRQMNPIQQNIYRFTALSKFSSRKVVKWPNGGIHFYRWVCFMSAPDGRYRYLIRSLGSSHNLGVVRLTVKVFFLH